MASSIKQLFRERLGSLGKAGLNALYPNDFDYYVVSLELVDSLGNTVEFLVFPVPPKSLSQTDTNVSTVKMNFKGITTINYPGFVPKTINVQGDFGRYLKILVGSQFVNASKRSESTVSGNYDPFVDRSITQIPFSSSTKTGYGAMKVLQAIHRKSNTLDQRDRPHKLFFYNPALGDNFMVKSDQLIINQSKETNMIWQYNLSMKAIAPAYAIRNDVSKSLRRVLTADQVQKASNSLLQTAKTLI